MTHSIEQISDRDGMETLIGTFELRGPDDVDAFLNRLGVVIGVLWPEWAAEETEDAPDEARDEATPSAATPTIQAPVPAAGPERQPLSASERRVYELAQQGLSNRDIAMRMEIKPNSVVNLRVNIRHKGWPL